MRLTQIFQQLVRSRDVRMAWTVAIAADAIQIIGLPLFAFGGLSPADTLVDVAAAAILSGILGWHWAFIPTLLAELVPGLDLFPTWTAAVAYVTWQRARSSKEDIRDIRDVRDVTDIHEERMPGNRSLHS
ncbi:MAG TPA: hypothetical protein VGK48_18455 [Terriglobia bacterium]|jgi:hypothetical protein